MPSYPVAFDELWTSCRSDLSCSEKFDAADTTSPKKFESFALVSVADVFNGIDGIKDEKKSVPFLGLSVVVGFAGDLSAAFVGDIDEGGSMELKKSSFDMDDV